MVLLSVRLVLPNSLLVFISAACPLNCGRSDWLLDPATSVDNNFTPFDLFCIASSSIVVEGIGPDSILISFGDWNLGSELDLMSADFFLNWESRN